MATGITAARKISGTPWARKSSMTSTSLTVRDMREPLRRWV